MFRYLCLYYAYLEQQIVALSLYPSHSLSPSLHLRLRLGLSRVLMPLIAFELSI